MLVRLCRDACRKRVKCVPGSPNSNPKAEPLPELTLTCPNRNLFSKFIMLAYAILNQSEPNVSDFDRACHQSELN